MSAGISEDEIEREIQTLRNLRRRSASSPGPGALAVDPDLPPPSPSPSAASTSYTSNDDVTLATPDGLDDDGSLFWVPAHLHPELAPGEFKAFLKAHTSSDPEDGNADDTGAAPGLARSGSWLNRRNSGRSVGGDGLGRKRSMLSRQYQPRAGDAIEEEVPPVPTRNGRGSIYRGRGGEKGLTLQDLQRLETMVDRVEEGSDDPTQMRSMLRRSLSMNVAPGFLQDDVAQGDEGDQPVVLPRPGSIIRRTARTRIRKDHLVGDGGGRRFASRRPRASQPPEGDDPSRRSSDGEEGASDEYNPVERFERPGSTESYEYEERYQDAVESQSPKHIEHRRSSDDTTDEGVIFDAYRSSRTSSISSESGERSLSPSPEPQDRVQERKMSLPPITPGYSGDRLWVEEGEKTPTQESVSDPMSRSFSAPSGSEEEAPRQGMRKVSGMKLEVPLPFETPRQRPISPTNANAPLRPTSSEYDLPPGMAPPVTRQAVPPGIALQHQKSHESLGTSAIDPRPPLSRVDSSAPPSPSSAKEKEKEKKGGFFGKKDKKEKEKKKEKEGFLGSLFGGHKKKQEEVVTVSNFSTAGPAAAAALLGSSKSAKSMGVSPTPSPTNGGFAVNAAGNFARYPIHVERAVYRLSHIKLANARRPLYEQVLISNLMFWYLGVIGRNVGEEKKAEKEDKKEKKEVEVAKPPPAKGTPPKSLEGGQAGNGKPLLREPEPSVPPPAAAPPQQSTLKKGLTKPERRRDGRDAEAPVRTPSYGMQNALVDSDLRAREARGESRESRDGGKGQRGMNGSPPPPPQQQQPQQAYQNYGPPPGGMPARSPSNPNIPPGDPRGRPPPGPPGGHQRPASDYSQTPQPVIPREMQGAPRGVPQSSFGPPPPPNSGFDPSRDPRQRTLSTPSPAPPPGQPVGPGPGGSGQMRRVVTEGRPEQFGGPPPPSSRPMAPSHSGPQPGQIFQYPGSAGPLSPTVSNRSLSPQPAAPFPPRGSSHPAPGQVFSPPPGSGPLPGQIFQRPPPNGHLPPPTGYPQHPGGPPRPLPELWAGPQRLPPPQPGQQAPYPPQHHPQHFQARPNFTQPQGPQQPFDPRRNGGPPPQGQYPPAGPGYAPGPGQYAPRPPQLGAPLPPQNGQPPQGYNPYAQPPGQGGEFRRSQAVPGQYGHHR